MADCLTCRRIKEGSCYPPRSKNCSLYVPDAELVQLKDYWDDTLARLIDTIKAIDSDQMTIVLDSARRTNEKKA